MRVVIADDSKLFRDRIKDLLISMKGLEIVGEAINGLEALQIIPEKKPDIVFLDIRMPEMNGIEVLKTIRSNGGKMVICMLTNYPYKQYKDRCFEEGADYFFDKNLDIKQISDVVTKLTCNKQAG